MKNATILHDLSPEQWMSFFDRLFKRIDNFEQNFQPKQLDELMTPAEVANEHKCDRGTIHNWTKKGKLKAYGIGNRVYYKRSEVEAALIPLNGLEDAV